MLGCYNIDEKAEANSVVSAGSHHHLLHHALLPADVGARGLPTPGN